MINIEQRNSKKCAGKTSLWVSFPFNQRIIDIVKTDNAVWHKEPKEWELPLSALSYLIDNLTYIDDNSSNLSSVVNSVLKSYMLRSFIVLTNSWCSSSVEKYVFM